MYIRLSFDYAAGCNPTENLLEHIQHNMIGKPPTNELIAIYYIENMIFRIETLWDLLAQLCNEFWQTGKKVTEIYFERYFRAQKTLLQKLYVSISMRWMILKRIQNFGMVITHLLKIIEIR